MAVQPDEFESPAPPALQAAEAPIEARLDQARLRDWRHRIARAGTRGLGRFSARVAEVILLDAVWLSVQPLDMRLGTEAALSWVIAFFSAARAHHAQPFVSRRFACPHP